MAQDWSVYIALFVAGAFPWISEIKNLDYHFEYASTQLKTIFNAFASLFAFSIFFFIKNSSPEEMLEYLDSWAVILGSAFILVILYLTIFFVYKKNSHISIIGVITAFILYTGIFCTLSGGFSLLYVKKDFHIIKGSVVTSSGKGVEAKIVLVDDQENVVKRVSSSRVDGAFKVVLRKSVTVERVNVYAVGYGEERKHVQNEELFDVLHEIYLTPNQQ